MNEQQYVTKHGIEGAVLKEYKGVGDLWMLGDEVIFKDGHNEVVAKGRIVACILDDITLKHNISITKSFVWRLNQEMLLSTLREFDKYTIEIRKI